MNTGDVLYAIQHDLRMFADDGGFTNFCCRMERRAGKPLSVYRLAEAYRRRWPDDQLALREALRYFYTPLLMPHFPIKVATTRLCLSLTDDRAQEAMGIDPFALADDGAA